MVLVYLDITVTKPKVFIDLIIKRYVLKAVWYSDLKHNLYIVLHSNIVDHKILLKHSVVCILKLYKQIKHVHKRGINFEGKIIYLL